MASQADIAFFGCYGSWLKKRQNKKSDVNGYFLMWLAIEFEWNIDKIIWISFVGNNG